MKKFLILCLSILFISPLLASGIGAGVTSVPCDNATLETYNGTANVEIDWQPNTINLNWYDGDTKLNVQNSAQTCNYGGSLTVPSVQPTRTGYTFKGWELKYAIPAEYTELQYIESTGTQWIDTGIPVKVNTLAKFEYQFTDADYTNYVFGQVAFIATSIMGYRSNRIWWFTPNEISFLDTYKHSVEFSLDGHVYRDGTIVAYRGGIFEEPQNLTILLFAELNDESGNTIIKKGRVKIFSFVLKEGATTVRNFIPARRNSDSVLGMYDTVSDVFLTNSGTGTFTAGPNVGQVGN